MPFETYIIYLNSYRGDLFVGAHGISVQYIPIEELSDKDLLGLYYIWECSFGTPTEHAKKMRDLFAYTQPLYSGNTVYGKPLNFDNLKNYLRVRGLLPDSGDSLAPIDENKRGSKKMAGKYKKFKLTLLDLTKKKWSLPNSQNAARDLVKRINKGNQLLPVGDRVLAVGGSGETAFDSESTTFKSNDVVKELVKRQGIQRVGHILSATVEYDSLGRIAKVKARISVRQKWLEQNVASHQRLTFVPIVHCVGAIVQAVHGVDLVVRKKPRARKTTPATNVKQIAENQQ